MYLGGNAYLLKTTAFQFSDKEFEQFCLDNRELRIERDADQNILIMSPTHSLSGQQNGELFRQVANWNIETGSGITFDSSTGFTLPDKSMRSPDVAWTTKQTWEGLSMEQRRSFAPICPEFVIELKSESDLIKHLQEKMKDVWLKNGTLLGLLIDPDTECVHIYHKGKSPEVIQGFDHKVSCDPVLNGFHLDLKRLKGE